MNKTSYLLRKVKKDNIICKSVGKDNRMGKKHDVVWFENKAILIMVAAFGINSKS